MAAHPSAGLQYGALPKFPNFKVHKLLGKGSYGRVYKVERESDKQLYALKEADLGAMSQAERADAVNEVRLLVSINHINVIRYHEAFLLGNKLCTVMEYAPFGDLKYYIAKGAKLRAPFPEEAVWRILLQMCRGLQTLHSQQVIHRDIKPANIFLCANDLLKIGDLGVAKALTHFNFARTQIGTPCYMAPEVWGGRPYSYSSDMWSLGAVLYEMLTFRTPMEGRTMMELRARIIGGRYSPIAPGRYSQELVNLCYSLLNTEPGKRPTPTAILNSSAAARWMYVLPEKDVPAAKQVPIRRWTSDGAPAKGNLLDTIVVPRDLRQLPKRLPPPSYDTDNNNTPPAVAGARPASWSGAPPHGAPVAAAVAAGVNVAPARSPPLGAVPSPFVPPPRSQPGSRLPSREGSRAPSPADVRPVADNRKHERGLPPHIPRAPSGGNLGPTAAALQAFQQRWTPNGLPVGGLMPRFQVPPRRASYN